MGGCLVKQGERGGGRGGRGKKEEEEELVEWCGRTKGEGEGWEGRWAETTEAVVEVLENGMGKGGALDSAESGGRD